MTSDLPYWNPKRPPGSRAEPWENEHAASLVGATGGLARRLREHAAGMRGPVANDLCDAADFIQSAEAVERERLEHEAVTPESNDLPQQLRETAKTIPMPDGEYAQHLMRMAADELEEWRAVDHNPPPFDENGVLNDEDAKAQHKLELNRRGWDYDEARGGFVRIALQPLEAGAADIPPDPLPWPLFPMREQYDSDEAYTRAMVAWGKAVHEIEEARNA